MAEEDIRISAEVDQAARAAISRMSEDMKSLVYNIDRQADSARTSMRAQTALNRAFGFGADGTRVYAKSLSEVSRNSSTVNSYLLQVRRSVVRLERDFKSATSASNKFGKETLQNLKRVDKQARSIRFTQAIQDAQSLSRVVLNLGKNMQYVGRNLTIGLTLPIVSLFRAGLESYKKLENEIIRFEKIASDAFTSNAKLYAQFNQELDDITSKYGVARELVQGIAADFATVGIPETAISDLVRISAEVEKLGDVTMEESRQFVQSLLFQSMTVQRAKTGFVDYGLAVEQVAGQLAMFNAIENNTVVTLKMVAKAIPEMQAVTTQFGLSLTEATAAFAPMIAAGFEVGASGNSIKVSLQRLVAPAKQNREILKELADSIGGFNFEVGVGIDAVSELARSFVALEKAKGAQGALELFARLFGVRQGSRMLQAFKELSYFQEELSDSTSGSFKVINTIVDNVNKAVSAAGLTKKYQADSIASLSKISRDAADAYANGNTQLLDAIEEGQNAAVDILEQGGKKLTDQIDSQAGRILALQAAGRGKSTEIYGEELARALESPVVKLARARETFKAISRELIPPLVDALEAIMPMVKRFAEFVKNLDERTIRLVVGLMATAAVIGPLITAFSNLLQSAGFLGGGLVRLTKAFSGLFGRSGLFVPAEAFAGMQNFDAFGRKLSRLNETTFFFQGNMRKLNKAFAEASKTSGRVFGADEEDIYRKRRRGQTIPGRGNLRESFIRRLIPGFEKLNQVEKNVAASAGKTDKALDKQKMTTSLKSKITTLLTRYLDLLIATEKKVTAQARKTSSSAKTTAGSMNNVANSADRASSSMMRYTAAAKSAATSNAQLALSAGPQSASMLALPAASAASAATAAPAAAASRAAAANASVRAIGSGLAPLGLPAGAPPIPRAMPPVFPSLGPIALGTGQAAAPAGAKSAAAGRAAKSALSSGVLNMGTLMGLGGGKIAPEVLYLLSNMDKPLNIPMNKRSASTLASAIQGGFLTSKDGAINLAARGSTGRLLTSGPANAIREMLIAESRIPNLPQPQNLDELIKQERYRKETLPRLQNIRKRQVDRIIARKQAWGEKSLKPYQRDLLQRSLLGSTGAGDPYDRSLRRLINQRLGEPGLFTPRSGLEMPARKEMFYDPDKQELRTSRRFSKVAQRAFRSRQMAGGYTGDQPEPLRRRTRPIDIVRRIAARPEVAAEKAAVEQLVRKRLEKMGVTDPAIVKKAVNKSMTHYTKNLNKQLNKGVRQALDIAASRGITGAPLVRGLKKNIDEVIMPRALSAARGRVPLIGGGAGGVSALDILSRQMGFEGIKGQILNKLQSDITKASPGADMNRAKARLALLTRELTEPYIKGLESMSGMARTDVQRSVMDLRESDKKFRNVMKRGYEKTAEYIDKGRDGVATKAEIMKYKFQTMIYTLLEEMGDTAEEFMEVSLFAEASSDPRKVAEEAVKVEIAKAQGVAASAVENIGDSFDAVADAAKTGAVVVASGAADAAKDVAQSSVEIAGAVETEGKTLQATGKKGVAAAAVVEAAGEVVESEIKASGAISAAALGKVSGAYYEIAKGSGGFAFAVNAAGQVVKVSLMDMAVRVASSIDGVSDVYDTIGDISRQSAIAINAAGQAVKPSMVQATIAAINGINAISDEYNDVADFSIGLKRFIGAIGEAAKVEMASSAFMIGKALEDMAGEAVGVARFMGISATSAKAAIDQALGRSMLQITAGAGRAGAEIEVWGAKTGAVMSGYAQIWGPMSSAVASGTASVATAAEIARARMLEYYNLTGLSVNEVADAFREVALDANIGQQIVNAEADKACAEIYEAGARVGRSVNEMGNSFDEVKFAAKTVEEAVEIAVAEAKAKIVESGLIFAMSANELGEYMKEVSYNARVAFALAEQAARKAELDAMEAGYRIYDSIDDVGKVIEDLGGTTMLALGPGESAANKAQIEIYRGGLAVRESYDSLQDAHQRMSTAIVLANATASAKANSTALTAVRSTGGVPVARMPVDQVGAQMGSAVNRSLTAGTFAKAAVGKTKDTVAPILTRLLGLVKSFEMAIIGFGVTALKIFGVLTFVLGPLVAVFVAIGIAIKRVFTAAKGSQEFRERLKKAFEGIKVLLKGLLKPFIDAINGFFGINSSADSTNKSLNTLGAVLTVVLEKFGDFAKALANSDGFRSFQNAARSGLTQIINILLTVAAIFKNLFEGDTKRAGELVQQTFYRVAYILLDIFIQLKDAFKSFINFFIDANVLGAKVMVRVLSKAFSMLVDLAYAAIKNIATGFFEMWKTILDPNKAMSFADKVFNPVLGAADTTIGLLADIFTGDAFDKGLNRTLMDSIFGEGAADGVGDEVASSIRDNLRAVGVPEYALPPLEFTSGFDWVDNALDGISADAKEFLTGEGGLVDILVGEANDARREIERIFMEKFGMDIKAPIQLVSEDTVSRIKETIEEIRAGIAQSLEQGGEELTDDMSDAVADAVKNAMQKFVDLVVDFLGSRIEEIKSEFADALKEQKEAALSVFDDQIAAIDALAEAEERLFQKQQKIEEERQRLRERALEQENYRRNRALAIYEGRIDDARQLDLENRRASEDFANETESIKRDTLRSEQKRQRDIAKEILKRQRDDASETFDEIIENFEDFVKNIGKYGTLNQEQLEEQFAEIRDAALDHSQDLADAFESYYTELPDLIARYTDPTVGFFMNPLNQLYDEAIDLFGLTSGSSSPSTILGATATLLSTMNNRFDSGVRDVSDTFEKGFDDVLELIIKPSMQAISDIIDVFDPGAILQEAFDHANAVMLAEYQKMIDSSVSLTATLVEGMDPIIQKLAAIEAAANSASDAMSDLGGSAGDLEVQVPTWSGYLGRARQDALDAMAAIESARRAAEYTANLRAPTDAAYAGLYRGYGGSIPSYGMGGKIKKYANGGYPVPGFGSTPVPAILHGGEFVINSKAVSNIGMAALVGLNNLKFKNMRMPSSTPTSVVNNTSTTNIYVDNFIGQDEWFNSMMKEYNVKVHRRNQKSAGLESRNISTYTGLNRGM